MWRGRPRPRASTTGEAHKKKKRGRPASPIWTKPRSAGTPARFLSTKTKENEPAPEQQNTLAQDFQSWVEPRNKPKLRRGETPPRNRHDEFPRYLRSPNPGTPTRHHVP